MATTEPEKLSTDFMLSFIPLLSLYLYEQKFMSVALKGTTFIWPVQPGAVKKAIFKGLELGMLTYFR